MSGVFEKIGIALASIWGLVMSILLLKSRNDNSKIQKDLNKTEFKVEKNEIEKTNSTKPLSEIIDHIKSRLGRK